MERKMRNLLRFAVLVLALSANVAMAGTPVTLYKSPTCGCCNDYVTYLRQNGFEVKAVDLGDMSAVKKRYGVTRAASCHTALIGGYVVEGHVPVEAIRKLLKQKPAIPGISVPGMPMNSPGMGEMKKGTLTVYRIPKGSEPLQIFSVE